MGILDADVKRIFKNTKSEFTGEALILGQWAICRNTDVPTTGWEWVVRDPLDGIYYYSPFDSVDQGEIEARVKSIKGFVNPDDITFTVDNPTRTCTVAQTGGIVKFESDGNYYEIANGDPLLSVVLSDESAPYYTFFNSSGQLTYEYSLEKTTVSNMCLCSVVRSSKATGSWQEISVIDRWEDRNSNPVENFASAFTKSILWNPTGVISLNGTLGGTTVGHSAGEAFTSRDHNFDIIQGVVPGKIWSIFYYLGVYTVCPCDKVERIVKTDTPYVIGSDVGLGGTNIVYNSYNGTTQEYELSLVSNNNYVIVFFNIADNPLVQVTSLMPQQTYANLSSAQDAMEDARAALYISGDTFRDIGVFAGAIFKGTGELQYADSVASELFRYFYAGVESGTTPAPTPAINEVLSKGTDAGNQPITNLSEITTNKISDVATNTLWENIYIGDGSDLPLDGVRRVVLESITGTAFGGMIRISSPNQQVIYSVNVDGDGNYDYTGGGVEDLQITELSFTRRNVAVNDFSTQALRGISGGKKYFEVYFQNSAELTIDIMNPYNIQLVSGTPDFTGYTTRGIETPAVSPSFDGRAVNYAMLSEKVLIGGEFTNPILEGATTSDTPSENRALGDTGFPSYGGIKEHSVNAPDSFETGFSQGATPFQTYTDVNGKLQFSGIITNTNTLNYAANTPILTINADDFPVRNIYGVCLVLQITPTIKFALMPYTITTSGVLQLRPADTTPTFTTPAEIVF